MANSLHHYVPAALAAGRLIYFRFTDAKEKVVRVVRIYQLC